MRRGQPAPSHQAGAQHAPAPGHHAAAAAQAPRNCGAPLAPPVPVPGAGSQPGETAPGNQPDLQVRDLCTHLCQIRPPTLLQLRGKRPALGTLACHVQPHGRMQPHGRRRTECRICSAAEHAGAVWACWGCSWSARPEVGAVQGLVAVFSFRSPLPDLHLLGPVSGPTALPSGE